MIWVVTWCWGDKYPQHYVDRLNRGVLRHLSQPHKFVVVSEGARVRTECAARWAIPDEALTKERGCFARLRIFDPGWLHRNGVDEDDKVLCIDLDAVITGPLDPLVDRPSPFTILQGVNSASHPCPYNGSIWMLRAGYRPDVWSDFSLEAAAKVPFAEFPDDQGWMHHKIPDAAAYTDADGVWAFHKGPWRTGDNLPQGARIVVFPGRRDPAQFQHLRWVRDHWLA